MMSKPGDHLHSESASLLTIDRLLDDGIIVDRGRDDLARRHLETRSLGRPSTQWRSSSGCSWLFNADFRRGEIG
jgi:hypothetical protein